MSAQLSCLPPVAPGSVPKNINMKASVEILRNSKAPLDSKGVLCTGSFTRVGGATIMTAFRNSPNIDHSLMFVCVNCHHVTNESSKSRHQCKMNDNPKMVVEEAESFTSEEEEDDEKGDEKGDEEVPKKKKVVNSSKKMAKKGS